MALLAAVDVGEARWLVPSMLVGIVVGGWLVAGLSAAALRRTIGAAALVFATVQLGATLRRRRREVTPASPATGLGVGLAAGVASTVAHSGGVVLALYLVGRPLGNAGVVALLYVGSWLGYRLNALLPRRAFGLALIGIAIAGSLRLLLA